MWGNCSNPRWPMLLLYKVPHTQYARAGENNLQAPLEVTSHQRKHPKYNHSPIGGWSADGGGGPLHDQITIICKYNGWSSLRWFRFLKRSNLVQKVKLLLVQTFCIRLHEKWMVVVRRCPDEQKSPSINDMIHSPSNKSFIQKEGNESSDGKRTDYF